MNSPQIDKTANLSHSLDEWLLAETFFDSLKRFIEVRLALPPKPLAYVRVDAPYWEISCLR